MTIIREVSQELKRAGKKFPKFASAHEGYAIILEELDELWDEIKVKHKNIENMRKEATQVAAMAIRFIKDVCESK